jgi:hypothetical protein
MPAKQRGITTIPRINLIDPYQHAPNHAAVDCMEYFSGTREMESAGSSYQRHYSSVQKSPREDPDCAKENYTTGEGCCAFFVELAAYERESPPFIPTRSSIHCTSAFALLKIRGVTVGQEEKQAASSRRQAMLRPCRSESAMMRVPRAVLHLFLLQEMSHPPLLAASAGLNLQKTVIAFFKVHLSLVSSFRTAGLCSITRSCDQQQQR